MDKNQVFKGKDLMHWAWIVLISIGSFILLIIIAWFVMGCIFAYLRGKYGE